jgi:hypothetical protein
VTSWDTGIDLTTAEEHEVRRLNGKHRDIRVDGAEVLQRAAVKKELQDRRQEFVTRHGLSCFRCGATVAEWVAGGKNQWGKYWTICSTCVRKPK